MYHITAHIYRHCVSITLITVKTMAMWRTVIRSGQVVPANVILKNPDGPSMKALHWILSCAMVTIHCHVNPIFFTSDSMSRRHVFLGRPLFLFAWGFHVRACLVMLDCGFLTYDQSTAIFFVLIQFLLAVELS